MIPPCDNGSCWWRWPFGTYNVGVRLDCIFCASEILGVLFFFYFSVGSHRRAENMIASTSWKASKLLKASRGDDFFLCLQIWPLPAFHLDPRAAKWHLSTRGHVGHFLLLSTKRETERFRKQTPFQNGTLHWLSQPLPWHQGCWGKAHGRGSWQQEGWCGCAATAEPPQCDVGFCLHEELNESLYGAMTLWFPRLAFQTPVCVCVCICTCDGERYTLVHVHTPTFAHAGICSHTGPLYSLQSKLDLNDSLETK